MSTLRRIRAGWFAALLTALCISPAAWSANVRFEDIATPSHGIDFRHERATFDPKLAKIMPWITAGGAAVAVADFDNDGLDDFYATTSKTGAPNKLYKNLGNLQFKDVAAEVGLADVNREATGTSSFALWFDFDNDGWRDLLLVRFGRMSLYRNVQGKRFEDATKQAGLDILVNATAAAAFDYDRSGRLSLLVTGYFPEVDMHRMPDSKILFDSWETATNGGRHFLFRNEGAGRFKDVTREAGIFDTGWTMAIGIGDLDNDGWPDVYLARDFGTDKVYRNNGNGTFSDVSARSIGVDTKKGMNAELGDYNNDGLLDVYVTNMTEPYLHECNMLWQNNGNFRFVDVASETGSCDTGWGWGGKFLDADNDGQLDLYVVNGFISSGPQDYMKILLDFIFKENVDLRDAQDWPDMRGYSMGGHERNVLFRQDGGTFKDIAAAAGVDDRRDGRGVAIADLDNDGRLDILVSNVDASVAVYRNATTGGGRWIGFTLRDLPGRPEPIGARVYVSTGIEQQMREISPANGFEAQSTLNVHFGLGAADRAENVIVVWPDGEREQLGTLPAGKYHEIVRRRKTGAVEPAAPQPLAQASVAAGGGMLRKVAFDAGAAPTRSGASQWAVPLLAQAMPAPALRLGVAASPPPKARVGFEEVAARSGVTAVHHPPVFDAKLAHIMAMVSAGAAGGAIGDVYGNGRDDILVTDSRAGHPNHLFVNQGDGTFVDRAVEAGVALYNDAHNVCTGGIFFDYDGDGRDDLLLLRFGSQVLLRNLGNGRFEDVSARSGVGAVRGNMLSAIAFDADRDGWVDLYLGAYFPDVDLFALKDDRVMHDSWEQSRNGGRNIFLRNNGDGTFTEKTREVGLEDTGWTMALGHADVDNDGWQDVYIANDYGPDRLLHNVRGRFVDVSERALGIDTKKGMNAEFGDFDNDGWPDIFVTNVTEKFLYECNMLWHNNGNLTFTDIATEMNVCDGGWGWGGKFADVDNDGWLDLYQVNGFFTGPKPEDYLTVLLPALWNNGGEDPSSAAKWPAVNGMSMVNRESNRLWLNEGGVGFRRDDGTVLSGLLDGRAVFVADFDQDGRIDFAVTNNDGPFQVFMNRSETGNHWIEFRLRGKRPNTDAAGARVAIETSGGRQYREVNIGNGFGGGSSRRVHFGLGKATRVESAIVRWPDGTESRLGPIEADRIVTVNQS